LFLQTDEPVETHRPATQAEERFALDIEVPWDIPDE
jgi:hypothetical protein